MIHSKAQHRINLHICLTLLHFSAWCAHRAISVSASVRRTMSMHSITALCSRVWTRRRRAPWLSWGHFCRCVCRRRVRWHTTSPAVRTRTRVRSSRVWCCVLPPRGVTSWTRCWTRVRCADAARRCVRRRRRVRTTRGRACSRCTSSCAQAVHTTPHTSRRRPSRTPSDSHRQTPHEVGHTAPCLVVPLVGLLIDWLVVTFCCYIFACLVDRLVDWINNLFACYVFIR